jgi:hypothetical protein
MNAKAVVNRLLEADEVDPEQFVKGFEPRYHVVSVGPYDIKKSYWGGGAGEGKVPNLETGEGYWHASPLDVPEFTREEAERQHAWLIQTFKSCGLSAEAAQKRIAIVLVSPDTNERKLKQRERNARRNARRKLNRDRLSIAQGMNESANPDDPDTFLSSFTPELDYRLRHESGVELVSPTSPGDGVTAPCRIVLHSSLRPGEWVTHMENMQVGGKFWGHYTENYTAALQDFKERCDKLGVDWRMSTVES